MKTKMVMKMMMMMMMGLVQGATTQTAPSLDPPPSSPGPPLDISPSSPTPTPSHDPSSSPSPDLTSSYDTTYYDLEGNDLDFPDLQMPDLRKFLKRVDLLRHDPDLIFKAYPDLSLTPDETPKYIMAASDPGMTPDSHPDLSVTQDSHPDPSSTHSDPSSTHPDPSSTHPDPSSTHPDPSLPPAPAKVPPGEGEGGPGRVLERQRRHFSTVDVCGEALCDQMVRQATGLARVKMVRRYIMDTVTALDSLVTALDAELVVTGETLGRSLGNRCRSAHALLAHVTKAPFDSDRLNMKSSRFVYGDSSSLGQ